MRADHGDVGADPVGGEDVAVLGDDPRFSVLDVDGLSGGGQGRDMAGSEGEVGGLIEVDVGHG